MRPLLGAVTSGAVAAAVALLANHAAVRRMPAADQSRWVRTNHAGAPVTLAEGPAAVLGLLAGVGAARWCGAPARLATATALAGLGAGVVGGYDDLCGDTGAKGFRGHLSALRRGTVTTGLVKILGVGASAAAAAGVLAGRQDSGSVAARWADVALNTALIAGTANLANLFDLRPGRTAKVVLVLGLPLTGAGAAPAVGAAVGCLPSDLAARSMLGDCGANALGAAVATAAAAGLPAPARLAALGAVAALNLASERVSFTAVIERTPWLRRLDQLGRARPAGAG